MNEFTSASTSRREFIKTTGRLAAVSALAGVALPNVHAEGSSQIQVALVGCGGRGTGAAANALSTKTQGPIKLIAMGDVFENRLNGSFEALSKESGAQVDVPQDRKFIGFDAYKKAMDCLKPGDVVILTTPPAFRWVHFTYAISKGLNVFMEKPVTVDGEIGDIILMRGYRLHGPVGSAFSTKWPGEPSEILWQISRFHSFLWASGGCFSDFYIHHIDHLSWLKNSWPVKAQALGGRHYRQAPDGTQYVDQNFDTYSVEYTFEDGAKMIFDGRCVNGTNPIYASYAHGSKGLAVVSKANDCGFPSSTFKGQNMSRSNLIWTSKEVPDQQDPYTNEWNDLMHAIREDKPYSEVKRGVEASLVTSMGRMAAHTGQEITFDDMLNCPHEFAPGLDQLTSNSPSPLPSGKDGRYPVPMPGVVNDREYGAPHA